MRISCRHLHSDLGPRMVLRWGVGWGQSIGTGPGITGFSSSMGSGGRL